MDQKHFEDHHGNKELGGETRKKREVLKRGDTLKMMGYWFWSEGASVMTGGD